MLLQMTQSFYTRLLGWQILRNLETYTLPPPPQRLANCSGNSMPLFLFNPLKFWFIKYIMNQSLGEERLTENIFVYFSTKLASCPSRVFWGTYLANNAVVPEKLSLSFQMIHGKSWKICICYNKFKSLINKSILCTEKNSEDDEDHTAHHRNGCLTKE